VAPGKHLFATGDKSIVVTAVDPDGPAAQHGITAGDVILDVGGKAVANAGEDNNSTSIDWSTRHPSSAVSPPGGLRGDAAAMTHVSAVIVL